MMTGEKLPRAVIERHTIVHLRVGSVDWHSTSSNVVEPLDDFVEATTFRAAFLQKFSVAIGVFLSELLKLA